MSRSSEALGRLAEVALESPIASLALLPVVGGVSEMRRRDCNDDIGEFQETKYQLAGKVVANAVDLDPMRDL